MRSVFILAVVLCGITFISRAQTASYSGITTSLNSADFPGPQGIATDRQGNLFIADAGKLAVYEMTRNGPAAYSAPSALPSPPAGYTYLRGIAIDSNGNLWVADFGNYPATPGQLYELVYNPATRSFAAPEPVGSGWQSPWAVAADASGNVFVGDNSANTISEISGHDITVVNSSGIQTPRGIAVDSGDNLFVVDGNTGRVMKLAPPYTAVTQVNNIEFQGPGDIALDASGNIWVSEYTNNLVRELTISDNYATVLSWGTGLNGPLAVWPDADGRIVVSDYNNHAVKQIATGVVNFGSTPLGSPSGVQTLYFTFTGGSPTTIQKPVVVTEGVTGKDFADAGSGTCTTSNGDSNPYAPGAQCSVVVTFAPTAAGARHGAVDLLDTGGKVLATALLYGTGNGPQLTFNPGKATTPVTGFHSPQKLAVDGNGNVFVVDTDARSIVEVPAGGGSPVAIASGFSFSAPYGIALDGRGNLFVSDCGTNQIDEIAASGGYSTVRTLLPTFGRPVGLALDADGNLYVADASSAHSVDELTAASGYSVVRTLSSSFVKPSGIAVDAAGNVFVADEGTTYITELIAADGQIPSSPATRAFGQLNSPAGVALDAAGNLYVADSGGGSVVELLAAGGYATATTLAAGASDPAGIAVQSDGNVYYSTNGSDNSVYALDLADAPALNFLSSAYKTPSADSPKAVILANIGAGAGSDLNVSGLTVTTNTSNAPGSFAQVSGSGTPVDCSATASLISGTSCNLSITFTPQYPEAITGVATITDNSLGVPGTTQTISLAGTGTRATPTLNWAAQATIVYGTPLSSAQLNATANVAGTFTYMPRLGSILPAGANQVLSVTFTPADSLHYQPVTATASISVSAATLTVSANDATRVYGTANPPFTGTITGILNSDTLTESFSTTATTASNAGTYPIVPIASGTNLSNYAPVTHNGTLTITKAGTTTSVSASTSLLGLGSTVSLKASVVSATTGTPTGTVSFYDGTRLLGSGTLIGGVAKYSTTALQPGILHVITAVYNGDNNFRSSNANAVAITVGLL